MNSASRRGIPATGELFTVTQPQGGHSGGVSPGDRLNPPRKRMPGSGSPDGKPYLLDEDQKAARPQRGAMNSPCGPQIVGCEQKEKDIGGDRRMRCFSVNQRNGPSRNRRD